jgi:hypothetical protein
MDEFRVVELRALGGGYLKTKNYSRHGAAAQRKTATRLPWSPAGVASLRRCVSNLHLRSLRFKGGRSAIR